MPPALVGATRRWPPKWLLTATLADADAIKDGDLHQFKVLMAGDAEVLSDSGTGRRSTSWRRSVTLTPPRRASTAATPALDSQPTGATTCVTRTTRRKRIRRARRLRLGQRSGTTPERRLRSGPAGRTLLNLLEQGRHDPAHCLGTVSACRPAAQDCWSAANRSPAIDQSCKAAVWFQPEPPLWRSGFRRW